MDCHSHKGLRNDEQSNDSTQIARRFCYNFHFQFYAEFSQRTHLQVIQHIKLYNQQISLALFCVAMTFYALGLGSLGKAFSLQTFIHIGGVLFILCNYQSFTKRSLKILLVPLICLVVVYILGLCTFFDDVLEQKFSSVLKSANTNILNYFILFILIFLYCLYARAKYVRLFLGFFAILCVLEVCATLFLGFSNGFFKHSKNVPFYFKAIFTYNIWLLAPMAMCLAGIFAFKKIGLKIAFILGAILTLTAMLANGERSFLVAFGAMLFVPFIVWHYKHKAKILCVVGGVAIIGIVGFYHLSKDLPPRYNFAYMLDNFITIWNTPPIEMGQFDTLCFKESKWLKCSDESLERGKSEISIEHSALSRINMTKSTLLAFLDNPLKPRIIWAFHIGKYLWHYYNIQNHQNRSYIAYYQEDSPNYQSNGYNHPHNFAVSLLFGYGIVGFAFIVIFQIFLLYSGVRASKRGSESMRFFGLVMCIFVCGVCVQSVFDAFYGNILQMMFIFLGALLGLGYRDEYSTNDK